MLWLLYCYTVTLFLLAAITISFVLNEYTVQEDVGSGLDALIAIQKDIVSELTITAFIQCLPGSNILVGSLFSPSATEGK